MVVSTIERGSPMYFCIDRQTVVCTCTLSRVGKNEFSSCRNIISGGKLGAWQSNNTSPIIIDEKGSYCRVGLHFIYDPQYGMERMKFDFHILITIVTCNQWILLWYTSITCETHNQTNICYATVLIYDLTFFFMLYCSAVGTMGPPLFCTYTGSMVMYWRWVCNMCSTSDSTLTSVRACL